MPYVVETPCLNNQGVHVGTFRHWVATEERARSEAEKQPDRSWREVSLEEMPDKVRESMERSI